jgi:hypothetical protein
MSGNTPNRTTLLNYLAGKYNLKRYLEIGLQSPSQNFDKIQCEYKVSVDPDPNAHASFCMTSDDFFHVAFANKALIESGLYDGGHQLNAFDLIFIDGLHTAEQVQKDFENALKILSPNGFICLHDCNPEKEEHTIVPRPTERGHWNGDVYKFAVKIVKQAKVTVDIDNGCMVVSPYSVNVLYFTIPETKNISWQYFDKHRKELLNLISWSDFVKL